MSLCIPWRINDCTVSLSVSDLMENVLISVAIESSSQRAFVSACVSKQEKV